jgi:creatinine amidohydrolase
VGAICKNNELKPAHANWLESFPFTIVTDLPDGEKIPPHVPGLLGDVEAKQILGDGSFGGPYQVDDSIMQEIFEACVADVLHILDT